MKKKDVVIVGEGPVILEGIVAVAKGQAKVRISTAGQFIKRMQQTQAILAGAIQNDVAVYGVNTGFGKSCGKRIPAKSAAKTIVSPLAFHGCGTGDPLGIEETRAAMLCRMICLATGYSGVSIELLEQIEHKLRFGLDQRG